MSNLLAAASAAAVAALMFCAAPASADPPPPGCERVPIFGLNPQVREICDTPIQPDGSWTRFRSFSFPATRKLNCRTYDYCEPGTPTWTDVPAYQGPVETYVVTNDTIPPGEPGHVD